MTNFLVPSNRRWQIFFEKKIGFLKFLASFGSCQVAKMKALTQEQRTRASELLFKFLAKIPGRLLLGADPVIPGGCILYSPPLRTRLTLFAENWENP